ncbi:MAG: DUF624 domain-containing protein [Succinivibrio sp.]
MSTPIVMACNTICRLCWIHILMVIMTLLGFVVFGIAPAIVVGSLLLRRYLNGTRSVTISMMWTEYKNEFVRANKVGLVFELITFVFFFYYAYASGTQGSFMGGMSVICLILMIFTMVYAYLTLVMMSFYDAKTVKHNLQNGAVMFRNVQVVLLTAAALAVCLAVYRFVPIISWFYGYVPVLFTTVSLMWLKDEKLRLV